MLMTWIKICSYGILKIHEEQHQNLIPILSFMRNDLPIKTTTPRRIFSEVIYGYKSECTKISEFLERNKDPYKTREIRMERETERNKSIPYKHMLISWGFTMGVYILII